MDIKQIQSFTDISGKPAQTLEERGIKKPNLPEMSSVNEQTEIDFFKQKQAIKDESAMSEQARKEIDDVVVEMNRDIQSIQRNLEFKVDDDTERVVITVFDSETNEEIRQIPSDNLMEVAKQIKAAIAEQSGTESLGILYDKTKV